MSEAQAAELAPLSEEFLNHLGELEFEAALSTLSQAGCGNAAAIAQLAQVALNQAEANPRVAAQWLAIANALYQNLGEHPALLAQIEYAQARLAAYTGDLAAAEAALRRAQTRWQAIDDQAALTRSHLGLTAILARQGRYAEAETAIRQAIHALSADTPSEATFFQLVRAYDNLATLLSYQDRHAEALEEYARVQQSLEAQQVQAETEETRRELAELLALNAVNRATSLTYVDQHGAAEVAFQSAIAAFGQVADQINRARAYMNLGILYLRTGRYAAALTQFDAAAADLASAATLDEEAQGALHQADTLLLALERAMAYVALNLVPEATAALDRCVQLYENSNQPYEWGQALFTLGMLHLRTQNYAEAATALLAAEQNFTALQNAYWINCTNVALAYLLYQQGDVAQTKRRLADLPLALTNEGASTNRPWDLNTLVEGHLLRLQMQLDQAEIQAARTTASLLCHLLDRNTDQALIPTPEINQLPLPHLQLRLRHALGRIEQQAGHAAAAQAYLSAAIDLLEAQRITLPLEELRTAFVDDKTDIYTDLLLAQLVEEPLGPQAIAAAFTTLERARSRSLLERLYAIGDPTAENGLDPQMIAQREEVRRQLHWLYNQSFQTTGGRRTEADLRREIQAREAQLQQLEWRTSPLLLQAQPVRLEMLQAVLGVDQQALIYHIADDEVLAFLIDRQNAKVVRRLCSLSALQAAQAELDFQLGRAELGGAYLARHAARLQTALRAALLQLYQLLIAPVADQLHVERLLFIPYGSLHLLPFHALWDGERYLLERFECTYAPSGGVAVHCQTVAQPANPFVSFAGFALGDATIPQAVAEVETVAGYFGASWVYLNQAANQAGLREAAQQADILHLATHGLFRPDNPFFSALKLADGWIDVRELYRLPLAARLVVLSACQSGAGRVQGGDEVIGLARGFLGAGAHTLLVSLWNVHDASAVQLMAAFYQQLTTAGAQRPAAALRSAQLAALQAQQHPYFWAPFLVIG
ncbi:MAG: CHAT domain-containing protein [Caldilineaceae bacterium]